MLLARVAHDAAETRRWKGSELVYLPTENVARLASLGHRQLVADYFWLQALQYYAHEGNRRFRYKDLHRYIDLITSVDPEFSYAYRFGATAVPYNSGRWTWHNVEQSSRIIERGLEQFPNDWQLWLQLGFNRGVIGFDYVGAAEAYRRAAAVPGAPSWIPQLVTRLYATGGSLERARAYAEQILSSVDDPEMRGLMERRLLEIDLEENLLEIDEASRRYRSDFHMDPPSVELLHAKGYLAELPIDPFGGTFYFEDGEARATSLHKGRLRVFEHGEKTERAQEAPQ